MLIIQWIKMTGWVFLSQINHFVYYIYPLRWHKRRGSVLRWRRRLGCCCNQLTIGNNLCEGWKKIWFVRKGSRLSNLDMGLLSHKPNIIFYLAARWEYFSVLTSAYVKVALHALVKIMSFVFLWRYDILSQLDLHDKSKGCHHIV